MGRSSFFVFATATRNRRRRPGPLAFRFIVLRCNYIECRGCPEPSSQNFFLFEDLHEAFSPRSTRYNPKAARWPGLPFISNSSSIFGSLVCRSRQTAELFLHGRSFFRSAEQSPVVAGITPSPTGVVFTTSTDSYPATLSQPWSSCSTHLLRRVLLSYSFRDQRKNLPWNDATPPTFPPRR